MHRKEVKEKVYVILRKCDAAARSLIRYFEYADRPLKINFLGNYLRVILGGERGGGGGYRTLPVAARHRHRTLAFTLIDDRRIGV